MKKLLVVFLCLVMLSAPLHAFGSVVSLSVDLSVLTLDDLYKLKDAIEKEIQVRSGAFPAELCGDYYMVDDDSYQITLIKDGTIFDKTSGNYASWSVDGDVITFVVDEQSFKCHIDGDYLIVSSGEDEITLYRK